MVHRRVLWAGGEVSAETEIGKPWGHVSFSLGSLGLAEEWIWGEENEVGLDGKALTTKGSGVLTHTVAPRFLGSHVCLLLLLTLYQL
jgi:hypothetical protein